MTTVTCQATAHLHHRMPVVLSPEQYAVWLAPHTRRRTLEQLLAPYEGALDVYSVSSLVNGGTVDDARCLDRVEVIDREPGRLASLSADAFSDDQQELRLW